MSTIDSEAADESKGHGGTTDGQSLDGIEIRTLHDAREMVQLADVFRQVWGSATPLMTIEILMAVSHSGGYVSAAYETGAGEERMLGASVGILARHLDRPALHSHITGLLPGARRSGLGRAMKLHQRAWAAKQDIDWITWTYDPLVRRNAWFNLAVLHAEVHEYLPSFYGTMSDSINAGGSSDRLLVAWPTSTTDPDPVVGAPDTTGRVLIPTPEDIVHLRRTDPVAVAEWAARTCVPLRAAIERGDQVVGFTTAGDYVIEETT